MPEPEDRRLLGEIIYRADLYPRFEPNPTKIQEYSENLALLPPIEINQRNELIDGYHRWTAHKTAKVDTIAVTVTPTASDRELRLLAVRRNAVHGLPLSSEEKKSQVLNLYTGRDEEKAEFEAIFSVSRRTLERWLARRDKDLKAERERRLASLWLACHTEQEIAEAVGLPQRTVSRAIGELAKSDSWRKWLLLASYDQDPESERPNSGTSCVTLPCTFRLGPVQHHRGECGKGCA